MHDDRPAWERFAAVSRSVATARAYAADWADFNAFCKQRGTCSLPAPPDTVGHYLAERATTLRPATLDRRLAAIAAHHREAGFPLALKHPAIARVRAGIRRTLGTAPTQKEPLTAEDVRALVAALPRTLAGTRDRALLLLGFAGAFRRSEMVALTRRDLVFTSEGLAVVLRRAKEDQEGRSQIKGIPFGADPVSCPVQAVKAWLLAAKLGEGPLFRPMDRHGNLAAAPLSGDAVAAIVKRAVATAAKAEGLPKAAIAERVRAVAGHSLRSGFVTSAAAAGAHEWEIMRHTGHKQAETVRRYIRLGSLFSHNLAGKVGL